MKTERTDCDKQKSITCWGQLFFPGETKNKNMSDKSSWSFLLPSVTKTYVTLHYYDDFYNHPKPLGLCAWWKNWIGILIYLNVLVQTDIILRGIHVKF